MNSLIYERYLDIKEKAASACLEAGRDPFKVTIIAVSKTFPATALQEAIDSGITLLGESRVQEAAAKTPLLTGDYSLHMVGHLQSNKAKDAVRLFDVIHSIDSVSTAEKVNREAEKIGKRQKILLQVNSSGEAQKSGSDPEQSLEIASLISEMNNIELLGLMTISENTDNEKIIADSFRITKKLLDKINDKLNIRLKELSMGMSSDYRIAIHEGATMIRIGSSIFGERY